MRIFKIVLLAIVLLILLSACRKDLVHQVDDPTAGTLKIALWETGSRFEYADLIQAKFPDLKLDWLSGKLEQKPGEDYLDARIRILEQEKPDLIPISSIAELMEMVKKGIVRELDSFIKKDDYDLKVYTPGVMALLRQIGEGKLYGLAPYFENRTLVYNKGLFDQFGVPYPTDGMSWEEVLTLADKFRGKQNRSGEPIVGFNEPFMSMFGASYFVDIIANTNGLQSLDADATTVMPDAEGWAKAIRLALDSYKNGVLAPPKGVEVEGNRIGKEAMQKADLFRAGLAAMGFDTTRILHDAPKLGFEIGAVASPVDPRVPDAAANLLLSPIYAIGTKAEHPEAAWEIIKFIMSDNVMRITSLTQREGGLPTRTNRLQELGPQFAPFYKRQKYDDRGMNNRPLTTNQKKVAGFLGEFNKMADSEYSAALEGKQTVDEAISHIRKLGQNALDDWRSKNN